MGRMEVPYEWSFFPCGLCNRHLPHFSLPGGEFTIEKMVREQLVEFSCLLICHLPFLSPLGTVAWEQPRGLALSPWPCWVTQLCWLQPVWTRSRVGWWNMRSTASHLFLRGMKIMILGWTPRNCSAAAGSHESRPVCGIESRAPVPEGWPSSYLLSAQWASLILSPLTSPFWFRVLSGYSGLKSHPKSLLQCSFQEGEPVKLERCWARQGASLPP